MFWLIAGLITGMGLAVAGAVFAFIKARQITNVINIIGLLVDEATEAKDAIERAIDDNGSLDAMKEEIIDVVDTLEHLRDAITEVF